MVRDVRDRKKSELLEFTRLSPFQKRKTEHLSGGMQKKLALACSLIHTPEILFLDEPTTGVDPISRREFWRMLYALPYLTIFVATPYIDEAERCNRISLIHNGKILLVNTPNELKKQITGKVIEMKCDEPYTVSELLKDEKSVISAQTFSDKIRVLLEDGADIQKIVSSLTSKGAYAVDVREVLPNVEDIFISKLAK